MKRLALAAFLLIAALLWGTGLAQVPVEPVPSVDETASDEPPPDEEPPMFRLEEARIVVVDKHKRPYRVPRDTAWIEVAVDNSEEKVTQAMRDAEVLEASGVRYPVLQEEQETSDPVRFPLLDGAATVQFVVFEDPELNPVPYKLTLKEKRKGQMVTVPLRNSEWTAGTGTPPARSYLTTTRRSPNQKWEWAAVLSFAGISLVLTYLLYGRSLFARMLRGKKMEVSSALGWSNLMILAGLGLILAGSLALYFFPLILWDKQYMIYLLVGGGCLLALLAAYGAGAAMTRA
ncbi:MAG: hypothetical protein AB1758_08115 [Candidatus Eremiobacterota bacterium]